MEISYKFAISPITNFKDPDAIEAINIYNRTTPPAIKTSTNDFIYRYDHKSPHFDFYLFTLYLNDQVIGLALATYVNRLLIFDYIAVKEKYEEVYSMYFSYIDLISEHVTSIHSDVNYYITEISASETGVDKESVRFRQLFCLNGYGAITFPYKTLPLGEQVGTSFDTWLYIKSNDRLSGIEKSVYIEIIRTIYVDYYCAWYEGILTTEQHARYCENAMNELSKLKKKLQNEKIVPVKMPTCQYTECCQTSSRVATVPAPYVRTPKTGMQKAVSWVLPMLLSIVVAYVAVWVATQLSPDSNVFSSLFPAIAASITACATVRRS